MYSQSGPPEVFSYVVIDDPVPGPGTLLVRNEAISIEGGDVLHRAGGDIAIAPHIVGYASAGVVEAVGSGVTRFAIGDRVATVGIDGSHAELRVIPETFAWRVPQALDMIHAACVPIAFGTAADALFEFGRLRPDETVFIQGGSGGVGVAAVQIAHRAGAKVITSASTTEKRDRLKALGADEVVDSTSPTMHDDVRARCSGRGIDLVVDNVGGAAFGQAVRLLAPRGRLVSVGEVGREPSTTFDIGALRERNLSVIGYYMAIEMLLGDRIRDVVDDLLSQASTGDIDVVVDRTFALSRAADAHAYIESRAAFGRVVLVPDQNVDERSNQH